jgi:hypothetical protein
MQVDFIYVRPSIKKLGKPSVIQSGLQPWLTSKPVILAPLLPDTKTDMNSHVCSRGYLADWAELAPAVKIMYHGLRTKTENVIGLFCHTVLTSGYSEQSLVVPLNQSRSRRSMNNVITRGVWQKINF